MKINSYRVPVPLFPRMSYAYNNSLDIIRDYNKLYGCLGMKEIEKVTYERIIVNICKHKQDAKFPVEISEVVRQEDTECIKGKTESYDNLDIFLKQQSRHSNELSVIVVDAKYHEDIYEKQNDDTLIVFLSKTERSEKFEEEDPLQIFSRRDQIKRDIGNLLERRVLKQMKEMCENLWKLKTSIDTLLPNAGESSSVSTQQKHETNKERQRANDIEKVERDGVKTRMSTAVEYRKLMKEDDSSHNKKSKKRKRKVQSRTLTGAPDRKKSRPGDLLQSQELSNISFLRKADGETVDKLLKSILALYRMTNIPESQQPQQLSKYQPKQLDEKLCTKLFSLSGSIKGMGYNSNILVILLSENADAKNDIEEKIDDLLRPQNVAYKIERVSEDLQLFMHVGAKLEPVPGHGTLGGFAIMGGTKNKKCILLSKHVAKCGREMYFESKRKVCKILQATTKEETGDLDIAAAEIYPTETVCNTQFRDSSGKEMKGILREYKRKDTVIAETRKVHIWGASSKPGKGVIEIAECKFRDEECQQTLIQIKDYTITGENKFAKPGDSGAIVCTDDPDGNFVHVIGMVMGDGSGGDGKTYYALPLSDGLKQLEKKTGHPFKLC